MQTPESQGGLSRAVLELIVAGAVGGWGCLLILDSRRMGAGWTAEGPAPGYFSFHVGLLLTLAAAGIAIRTLRSGDGWRTMAASAGQIRRVAGLFVPGVALVVAVPYLGLPASAALFLGWCMRRLGRFSWAASLAAPAATWAALVVIFEIWFRLPLPNGPVERALGF